MRAVVVTALGGPEVLAIQELDEPRPGPGEVSISVDYASVNFADIKARRGSYHGKREPPFIPGLDVAGRIRAVGEGVTGLEAGQEVAAATSGGAYAPVAIASQELCYPIPPGADPKQAAGVIVLMTAYNVLVAKGGLQAGESVLVQGAAGGVGTVLLQLAKLHGAGRVIAAVGSEAKRAVAERYRASDVVVGRGETLVQGLKEVAPDGVDLILDPVAGPHFGETVALLNPFGRVVVYGNAGGDGHFETGPLHSANRTVIGYSSGHLRRNRPETVREAALSMLELLASGQLEVPVSRVLPLEDAAEAHRLIESRETTGKLLLEP